MAGHKCRVVEGISFAAHIMGPTPSVRTPNGEGLSDYILALLGQPGWHKRCWRWFHELNQTKLCKHWQGALKNSNWCPEVHDLWRWGSGMRNPRCRKISRRAIKAKPRNFFWAVRLSRARHWWDRLRCPVGRAEGRGDFVEPRVELDCLRQFLDAEINGALADTLPVGVTVNAV